MLVESILCCCVGSQLATTDSQRGYFYAYPEKAYVTSSAPYRTAGSSCSLDIILSNNGGSAVLESSKRLNDNYSRLIDSFDKNVAEGETLRATFKRIANRLSVIPSKEVLVQYNHSDDALSIQEVLTDGVVLSMSLSASDADALVDFTIRNGQKLLVYGEMTIGELVHNVGELPKL